jgi:hypothetical protein
MTIQEVVVRERGCFLGKLLHQQLPCRILQWFIPYNSCTLDEKLIHATEYMSDTTCRRLLDLKANNV